MELSPEHSKILSWVKEHIDDRAPVPAFFYFSEIAGRRARLLRDALGPAFELYFSVKANPNEQLLRYLSSLDVKLDISSAGELERALTCGFTPSAMSFVGPGKTETELRSALHHRIGTIAVESLSELTHLHRLATTMEMMAPVSLRLHPREFISPAGRRVQNSPSAFGISEDQLPDVLGSMMNLHGCRVDGIHVHVGSMYFNPELIVENFRHSVNLAHRVRATVGSLKYVNLGGGFGIPYRSADLEIDLAALNDKVSRFLREPAVRDLEGVSFRVESGRFLVGSAGCYVTRILQRKKSFGRTYLVVEGGMNHHLAATGYGQNLRSAFPMTGISRQSSGEFERVHVAGSSCYSMDILAEDVELPRLEEGDLLVVFQSGAYGPSFSPGDFLSRPPAVEVVI